MPKPSNLLTSNQSKTIIRQRIEALTFQYALMEKEVVKIVTNFICTVGLKKIVRENTLIVLTWLLQEMADRHLPNEVSTFSRRTNLPLFIIASFYSFMAGISPFFLDRLLYSYNFFPVDQAARDSMKKGSLLAKDPNASLQNLEKTVTDMEFITIKNRGITASIIRLRPFVYIWSFLAVAFSVYSALIENRNPILLALQLIYFAPLIRILYDMISYEIYSSQKEKNDAFFLQQFTNIIKDIPHAKFLSHTPTGPDSTFFEFKLDIHPQSSMADMKLGNLSSRSLCQKDVMKTLLFILQHISEISLVKYDEKSIALIPNNGWQKFNAIDSIHTLLEKKLIDKINNSKIRDRLLPELKKATLGLCINWQSIEVHNLDKLTFLQFIANVEHINHDIKEILIAELKNIFSGENRVYIQYKEVVITPVLKDIHEGSTKEFQTLEHIVQNKCSAPISASGLTHTTTSSAAAAAAVVAVTVVDTPVLPTSISTSSVTKRKYNPTTETSLKATVSPTTALQISWPGFPSFDSTKADCSVYPLRNKHNNSFSFFLYIDPELDLDSDILSKMKSTKITGEKGQGFKRTGTMYRDSKGNWQSAFYKFKIPSKDGRAYARLADTKTHPEYPLLLADGYNPHPHKK